MSLCGLAKQVEILGHERGQFIGVVAKVVQQVLDSRAKFAKGSVEAVPRDVFAEKLPEAFDQVEVGRIRW